jgi:HEPN domain-containing protein
MPERERVIDAIREWVVKAENDLTTAAHTLKLGERCPTDTVSFHAQQCVEKYLKALLVDAGIDFPKTHDIEALVALVPRGRRPKLSAEEQAGLTEYATVARYPGWGPIPLAEARRAVAMARRVRADARRILPKEALTRRRQG